MHPLAQVAPYHLATLAFGPSLEGDQGDLQLFWPMVVAHRIDSSSPLYSLGPKVV